MRRYAAPGPPAFRDLAEPLGVWPLAQIERDARGLLHGEIAGGKRIGMAETEQQINVGGPRSDAVQRGELRMRLVGGHVADGAEIDVALCQSFADFADRLDLGRRQAEPLELVGARLAYGVVVERIERGEQPLADRAGACRRKLLPADDGAKAGKTRLPPAQRKGAGLFRHGFQTRILEDQLRQRSVEIGLGVEEVGHGI